jgi:predicted transcriptional regulator
MTFRDKIKENEKDIIKSYVLAARNQVRGILGNSSHISVKKVARVLGISQTSEIAWLTRKLKHHNIDLNED